MKIFAALAALFFTTISMAMDAPKPAERIKAEIESKGFAFFNSSNPGIFSQTELALFSEAFSQYAIKPENIPQDDAHATAYGTEFYITFCFNENLQISKITFTGDKRLTPNHKIYFRLICERVIKLFPLSKNTRKVEFYLHMFSDCEHSLREGIKSINQQEICEVNIEPLRFHQDRRVKEGDHAYEILWFQVLETHGFAAHNSLIGTVLNDSEKILSADEKNAAFYCNSNVNNIIKIPCETGSGYAVYQVFLPLTVHGHDGFKTYISKDLQPELNAQYGFSKAEEELHVVGNENFVLPSRKVMVIRGKITEDLS